MLAKLPSNNWDGQLKSICVDKKTDKINIQIATNIRVIRTMAALDVIITLATSKSFSKKYVREFEND